MWFLDRCPGRPVPPLCPQHGVRPLTFGLSSCAPLGLVRGRCSVRPGGIHTSDPVTRSFSGAWPCPGGGGSGEQPDPVPAPVEVTVERGRHTVNGSNQTTVPGTLIRKSSQSVRRPAAQKRLPGGRAVGSKAAVGISQVRSSREGVQSLGGGRRHV